MASLTMRNVRKSFGRVEIIKGVDLDIADGEFVVFVGPSGCGKSTLLRMVAGLEEITSGDILIDDKLCNDIAPKDRGIAMVFQSYALYPHKSVYANMAFALEIAGFSKADVVLIGVSRTSKTPLSMYMAHKKYKVANLPLVPEVPLPEEIFHIPPYRIIGLIIDPYKLNTIRSERMKALGFSGTANYTDIARIEDELSYAKEVMRQLHCMVIDVSNKAIEETASRIMAIVQRNKELYGDKY